MNIQPTPISDRIVSQFRKGEAHSDGLILTMVDLEIKLAAALAEIDRLDVSGIHTCHSECQQSNCVLRRELAAVTEQRDEAVNNYETAQLLSVRVGEQRDRLAVALERLEKTAGSPAWWDDPARVQARQALQSLTPKL